MTTAPGPGRPSSLSRHPQRAEVEVSILQGEAISAITARTGLAGRSLRRSAAKLRANAREAAEQAELVTVPSLVASFVDVALDAHAAREAAAEAGDARARIQAQRAESQALRDLASIFGITDASVIEELDEAERWVKTFRRVMAEYGAPLARALSKAANAEGDDELAEIFETVAAHYSEHPPARLSSRGDMP